MEQDRQKGGLKWPGNEKFLVLAVAARCCRSDAHRCCTSLKWCNLREDRYNWPRKSRKSRARAEESF